MKSIMSIIGDEFSLSEEEKTEIKNSINFSDVITMSVSDKDYEADKTGKAFISLADLYSKINKKEGDENFNFRDNLEDLGLLMDTLTETSTMSGIPDVLLKNIKKSDFIQDNISSNDFDSLIAEINNNTTDYKGLFCSLNKLLAVYDDINTYNEENTLLDNLDTIGEKLDEIEFTTALKTIVNKTILNETKNDYVDILSETELESLIGDIGKETNKNWKNYKLFFTDINTLLTVSDDIKNSVNVKEDIKNIGVKIDTINFNPLLQSIVDRTIANCVDNNSNIKYITKEDITDLLTDIGTEKNWPGYNALFNDISTLMTVADNINDSTNLKNDLSVFGLELDEIKFNIKLRSIVNKSIKNAIGNSLKEDSLSSEDINSLLNQVGEEKDWKNYNALFTDITSVINLSDKLKKDNTYFINNSENIASELDTLCAKSTTMKVIINNNFNSKIKDKFVSMGALETDIDNLLTEVNQGNITYSQMFENLND